MIHDLFLRRYPNQIYLGDRPTPAMHRLFVQAAHILYSDLGPPLGLDQAFFQKAHDAVARELGSGRLFQANSYDAICGQFLTEAYDLWNDRHGMPDTFLKARLSLVELLFRGAEERVAAMRQAQPDSSVPAFRRPPGTERQDGPADAVAAGIRELNQRFQTCGFGLHYHNGLLQFAQDKRTEERIAEPCWSMLRDPKWANVDRELKEAFDRSDGGRQDAAFHAAKALESTIKIISDDQGCAMVWRNRWQEPGISVTPYQLSNKDALCGSPDDTWFWPTLSRREVLAKALFPLAHPVRRADRSADDFGLEHRAPAGVNVPVFTAHIGGKIIDAGQSRRHIHVRRAPARDVRRRAGPGPIRRPPARGPPSVD
jgi:hypothetical protein